MPAEPLLVSVIIPARNEAATIAATVRAVRAAARSVPVEVIVVDDGSTDATGAGAAAAGARVLRLEGPGNPGAARNRGAELAVGDPLIFLDADCRPRTGWLEAILAAHAHGAALVGGSLALPPSAPLSARCDYLSSAYHVHPGRPSGSVANHPPANLSVRRDVFGASGGFAEIHPAADGHEELAWQYAARRAGQTIRFVPEATVEHRNRPGWGNLLRRAYRWGYSALESKANAPAVRLPWLYRHPRLALCLALPRAGIEAIYVTGAWIRARRWDALVCAPAILAARLAWAVGFMVGGGRWLGGGQDRSPTGLRPLWR